MGRNSISPCTIRHVAADDDRFTVRFPAATKTEAIASAAFRRSIGKIHALGRTGRAEEVAALVAFLASEDAAFITGQVYPVDDGRMTKLSLPQT
ncbi:SDR family oxidoreductase [Martelella mediterranea]|uniref:Enoyl-ACP reductase-like protein n=1 Tax=Martelella mediterranea TaxID=293089 RepID=A0A4R3NXD6_9HYPH|nr:SDR family oxidoreductase [Martelella mediterranea]TCT37626.1 enoyl-ACP reductase-like protein [Martelella mediterranea]